MDVLRGVFTLVTRRHRQALFISSLLFLLLLFRTFRWPHFLWKKTKLPLRTEFLKPIAMTIDKEPVDGCPFHTFLVVLVHSEPSRVQNRMSIRQTWGSTGQYDKTTSVYLVFLLGRSRFDQLNAQIEYEHAKYGDIVQGDFIESWNNLTYKSVLGLTWFDKRCYHAQYVLKSDDDVLIDTFSLLNILMSFNGRLQSLLCYVVIDLPVIRDVRDKHQVTVEEYADDDFVDYCSGSAYVMPARVASKLVKSSKVVPLFKLQDVYITGLLPMHARVSHEYLNWAYTFREDEKWQSYKETNEYDAIFTYHPNVEHLDQLWKFFKERVKSTV